MTIRHAWKRVDNTIYQLIHDGYSKGVETFRNRFSFLVNFDKTVTAKERGHILSALTFAGDHALIAKAYTQLGARWESPSYDKNKGKFCMLGIRYGTTLNEFGVPILTTSIREAILYYDCVN